MAYQNSLKYYRDLNNAVNTSWEDGREVGREEERLLNLERQRSLLSRLLSLKVGPLPEEVAERLAQLTLKQLDILAEHIVSADTLEEVIHWLDEMDQL